MLTMHFVVTIQYPTVLEPQVVRNYVQMAIKKYDKLAVKHANQSGYFHGVYNDVGFNVTEIPQTPDQDATIRDIVHQVKTVKDHLDKVDKAY